MNYAAQKFTRSVMGSNNIDSCNRTRHAPSVVGLAAVFGAGGGTSSYREAEDADLLVIAGSVIRVELLPGMHVFDLIIAAVLIPLGGYLVLTRPARTRQPDRPARLIPAPMLMVLAAVVGCAGGIYGIGGGAVLAPVLIGSGHKPSEAAPAALASTFVTSAGGVITFAILALHQHIPVEPDWPTGIALGIGGLAGGYTGARLQSRMPDLLIRRLVGVLVIAIGAYFLSSGLASAHLS
jgi:uncharacterized protein